MAPIMLSPFTYSALDDGLCIGEGDEDEEGSEEEDDDDDDEEDGSSEDSDELLDVEKKARHIDVDRWAISVQSAHVALSQCSCKNPCCTHHG